MPNRLDTILYTGTLVTEECCVCFITFAIPRDFQRRAENNHSISFYCPKGHAQNYTGPTPAMKLRAELEQAQRQVIRERNWRRGAEETAEQERRSKAAIRGHMTRMRNKIAAGVCPVGACRRHFTNVHEHLQHEHASWLVEHDIELDAL